ncbi:MAG: hypothetical protein NTW25_00585, partial [Candidatus Kapabacteria bacterium]|nr:hypothetical protein [Candidatus Kapabacteria bacterium]
MSKEIIEVINNFNPKNLNLPNLYRWDDKFKRYYFEIDNVTDEVTFYPSVTTILSKVLPESEFLSMKKTELGKEYWTWMNELASQGTFIHQELAGFFETGTIDFTTIQDRIKNYILESKQQYSVSSWCRVVLPKIISFIKFAEECNVEPILIESTVKFNDDNLKWAGTIDLLAYIDINKKGFWGDVYKSDATHGKKGDPKESTKVFRELCLIDFKSGTADIDSYAMQLQMYKLAIEQNMNIQIDNIVNVKPKEYKSGNV